MKTIKGICIKKRNFDKFKKVADLIYFDGPLLSHYVTNKGDNYLFYWIDQDDTNNRWMFIRTDYDNIQKYTNKKQTLRNVLSSPLDDIVYTVDIDEEGNHHNFQAHSIEDLPEDYLPTEDSYYEFEPEDVNKRELIHSRNERQETRLVPQGLCSGTVVTFSDCLQFVRNLRTNSLIAQ